MNKIIKFFKKNNKWYADIPNHTLEENEMVMGADIFLDWISKGKKNVKLATTTEETWLNMFPFILSMIEHDGEGATYSVAGSQLSEFLENVDMSQFINGIPTVWLCNVMHDVFGEHPRLIYVYSIEN